MGNPNFDMLSTWRRFYDMMSKNVEYRVGCQKRRFFRVLFKNVGSAGVGPPARPCGHVENVDKMSKMSLTWFWRVKHMGNPNFDMSVERDVRYFENVDMMSKMSNEFDIVLAL